jgi:hypothetical protein
MRFLAALLFSATLLASQAAFAQTPPELGTCFDAANRWCVQPAAALGWQVNLKTVTLKNAVALVGYTLVYQSRIPLGVGLYGGVGVADSGPNAPQLDLLVNVANFGAAGFGVQIFRGQGGNAIYQALFTLALNLNSGGTTTYLRSASPPVTCVLP